MRILMLNYEYPPVGSGGGMQSMQFAKEYAKSNEVYFLTTGWNEFGVTKTDGYLLHRLKTKRKRKDRCSPGEMMDFVLKAREALPKIVSEFKPDFVHVFFTIPTGLVLSHPLLKKIPYVVSVRGSDVPGHSPDRYKLLYRLIKPAVKKIWRNARAVVCNSEDLKKEVCAILPSLPVKVIPNGVDSAKFKPAKNRPGKRITLLYVGRLIPLKRIEVLIRQLPSICAKREAVLRIVGTGSEERRLKVMADTLNLSEKVVFVGDVPYDEIEKEYQKADIYLQLSKVEGMSNTVVEAMASGLPVITTDVGGARGFVKDGGLIITEDQVASGVDDILKDYGRFSRNARKNALVFSFATSAEQYLELMR